MTMTDMTAGKGRGWRLIAARTWFPAAIVALILLVQGVFSPGASLRLYLAAGLVLFGAVLFVRLVEAAVRVWYAGRRKPYPLPNVLRGLILAIVYLALLFYVLKNILHVDLTAYLAGSAVLTMVLGLAFQGVLSNIFSGMSLHFTKSFSCGDWVSVGAHEGIVVDTNWRETRLLDRQSNIVVLPNNVVASERITNYSQPDSKSALTVPFKLSYEAPAAEALQLLVEAARECPDVIEAPSPLATIQSYDELGVSYLLKFWITDYARKDPIITNVARLAWYKLRRHGIEIAMSFGNSLKDLVRAAAPRAIEDRDITFRDLLHSSILRRHGDAAGELIVAEDEVRALAALLERGIYTKGEVLFRQGEKGTSAFVVAKGLVRGQIAYEEGGKMYMSDFTVGPGGIFGEMSLFTGMPRTATGIVAEESELLEIRGEEFAVLLDRNPALAEEIAETVSARNEKNREFLSKIKELSAQDIQTGTSKTGILEHLRRFVRRLKGSDA
jgi:small-conductance mechanosensitive channel/CRP-like cAMP-binding protein